MNVAIIKPDHLGDLILASPAIRAAQKHFGDITLYVGDSTRPLASFLFPDIEIRAANFPHLARQRVPELDSGRLSSELNAFDIILWLRNDSHISELSKSVRVPQHFSSPDHRFHESWHHKQVLLQFIPNYSRTQLFSARPIQWPRKIEKVGLSISAGFPTNRWPNIYWLELATSLIRSGIHVTLIGGPNEQYDLRLLSRCLSALPHSILVGSHDFKIFQESLDNLDLVVASDSGTAHICSLRKPILSIFGSSPWRRFAPFGHYNVVLTRNLACSPCVQFSSEEVNGCMTRECLIDISSEVVLKALNCASSSELAKENILLQKGTSHLV